MNERILLFEKLIDVDQSREFTSYFSLGIQEFTIIMNCS